MKLYAKKKGRLYLLSLALVGATIIIILLGSINPLSLFTSYPFHMPGIMGPNMMGTQNIMTIQGQPIPVQQAVQTMRNIPSYAKVISHNNTIIFSSKDANLVALAMMPERAVNLTGMVLPSYSKEDVFVIYGLINPTLVIPKGTSVQFRVINLDDDMCSTYTISTG